MNLTVKEIIEQLQKCPQDATVQTETGNIIEVCSVFADKLVWFEDDNSLV